MKTEPRPSLTDRLDWLVDWLYPPRCRACAGRIHGRDAEYFCASCWTQIQLVSHPLCTICGRPFPDGSGDDHTYGVPMDPFVLLRKKETLPQTQLSEEERRKNVRGAFALNPARSVDGKSVLLVHDVYTSAATLTH